MAVEQFSNNAQSSLTAVIAASDTTLTVANASTFPAQGNFRILIDAEILLVTAVSGNTFTVSRGVESTTAAAHVIGSYVTQVLTHAALLNCPRAMTTTGDLEYLASTGAVTRLGAGSNGQVLTLASGLPSWAAAPVTSVAGKTGAVTLTESDIASLVTDLAAKVPTTRTVSAGTGLSGGGALSADRTLSLALPSVNDFRLTVVSGTPVPTTDQVGAGTLYLTPYKGAMIATYDSSVWTMHTSTEVSLALSSLTSGKNYDVFAYFGSGTITLELSAAWTNDTTRADSLAQQDGVWVKSSDHSRRWLGTIRTTATTTTEDSEAKRFVWNWEHRSRRRAYNTLRSVHTYNGNPRYFNNDSSQKVEFVLGEAVCVAALMFTDMLGAGGAIYADQGIGVDSSSALTILAFINQSAEIAAAADGVPAILSAGYHYLASLETTGSTGTATFAEYRLYVDLWS